MGSTKRVSGWDRPDVVAGRAAVDWSWQRAAAAECDWLADRKMPFQWQRLHVWRVERVLVALESTGGSVQVGRDSEPTVLGIPQASWRIMRPKLAAMGVIRIVKGSGQLKWGIPRRCDVVELVVGSETWRADFWEIVHRSRTQAAQARKSARRRVRNRVFEESLRVQERRESPDVLALRDVRDRHAVAEAGVTVADVTVAEDEVEAWSW